MGIEAGSYGRVAAVNARKNLLTVEIANANQVTYDPKRLSGVTVYQEIEREFSARDRVQFTAPQKQLGVANREMGTIEKIAHDGNISLQLDDGRKIEFDAALHRHFDHGYAVTSHSAQGLTSNRALINGDTATNPELLNARFAYVSVSRARLDAEIYTNDVASLSQKLSAETGKSSAIEFRESLEISSTVHSTLGQGI